MRKKSVKTPEFLVKLLNSRSPSGYEAEAQAVFDHHVEPKADLYSRDPLGNRIATVNPDGDPVLMLAGHFDELGLIIMHVSKDGFLYFDTIGGHDRIMIPGRRVRICTRKGFVTGVTGKRAIHLLNPDERKKLPQIHEMWIDIGASDRNEALSRISIGDVATYDHDFEVIAGSRITARAVDNKAGAYVVGETLIRLAATKVKKTLKSRVVSVATAQEEIGVRGATTSAYSVRPHIAVAVDVGHATDHPDADHRKFGDTKLGGGPMICRGANINPWVHDRLVSCAEKGNIPFQIEADPRPTGTDARAIQISRGGVATGLISIPLRYMHTPCEVCDLNDIENCVQLLVAFARSLKKGEYGIW
ncbi:MAG: M42 family peptidase [Verrucomicrobia bacterium]|nr:MAG: M42 family peptidase [Verrucomicrobiota bacterium]